MGSSPVGRRYPPVRGLTLLLCDGKGNTFNFRGAPHFEALCCVCITPKTDFTLCQVIWIRLLITVRSYPFSMYLYVGGVIGMSAAPSRRQME